MDHVTSKFRVALAGAMVVAGVLAVGVMTPPLSLAADDATPQPGDAISSILWQMTSFEDTARGSTPVDDPAKYTLQFLPEGRVAIGADCNQGSAVYAIAGSSLELGEIASTLALCEPESLSDRFFQELGFVRSFVIDQSEATDRLVLSLMADGGFLHFSPVLTGVVWEWDQFEGGDGAVVAPENPSSYTLEFQNDGSITGQVDCNRGLGGYEVNGGSISITLGTTRMPCEEGSLDAEFTRYVSEANTFVIRDGKLALALPVDSGIASFTPRLVEPGTEGTPEADG